MKYLYHDNANTMDTNIIFITILYLIIIMIYYVTKFSVDMLDRPLSEVFGFIEVKIVYHKMVNYVLLINSDQDISNN